ncbi:glycosyltransferase family 4 protein [bacterium]|nr:glycosyltransferase family 4 protein [candidate division CSSED10-310 bacterium]
MKILHINNSSEGGGTETYISRVINALDSLGYNNGLFIQKFNPGNHPLQALSNTRYNISKLATYIRQFSPDVIHVHNINNFKILQFLIKIKPCLKSIHEFRPFCTPLRIQPDTGKICDRSLSVHCFRHGCFSLNPSSLYRFMADRSAVSVLRRFPVVWVMSHYMERMIRPILPASVQLDVVPYFYDPPSDNPPPLPAEKRIFTAGRLVKGKGFEKLFDILSRVTIPFQLRIAGDGPERRRLETIAFDRGINVEFLGSLPSSELIQHYCWSRLVVFPSTYPEPFGIVGLEAMGAARPVIAFDVGGISEWLRNEETGFVIKPDDMDMFANRVTYLLERSDMAEQMGIRGRNVLAERFSSKEHIQKLVQVYQHLGGCR